MGEWARKAKGSAKIYTHPQSDRAVVVNHFGVRFNGKLYPTLQSAQAAALEEAA